eukprot:gene5283-8848_t
MSVMFSKLHQDTCLRDRCRKQLKNGDNLEPEDVVEKWIKAYGSPIVEFSLCCIAAARDGIAMSELEDVVSLNDNVLNPLFEKAGSIPSIRRIPKEIWLAFVEELQPHLSEKIMYECPLQTFASEDMLSHVESEYLSNLECFVHTHTLLGEYFGGVWSGETQKPYINSKQLCEIHNLPETGASPRFVDAQPLIFPSDSNRPAVIINGNRFGYAALMIGGFRMPTLDERSISHVSNCLIDYVFQRYNIRKLREQAHHLIASCKWKEVVDNCFSNYQYLRARIACTSVDELLEEYDALPERIAEPIKAIFSAIREARQILSTDAYQLASQLAARLLPYPTENSDSQSKLVPDSPETPILQLKSSSITSLQGYLSVLFEGVRQRGELRDVILFPVHMCIPSSSGSPLETLKNHDFAVHGIAAVINRDTYVSVSDDKSAKIWNIHSVNPLHTKQVLSGWGRCAAMSETGEFAVVGGYDCKIFGIDTVTGNTRFALEGHTSFVNDVAVASDGKLVISAGDDSVAIVWDCIRCMPIVHFRGHSSPVLSINQCSLTRVASGGSDGILCIWEMTTGILHNTIYTQHGPVRCVAATRRSTHIISGGDDGVVCLWTFPERISRDIKEAEVQFSEHTAAVTDVQHTLSGSGLILSASKDTTIRLWNFVKRTPVAVFTCDSAVLSIRFCATDLVLFGTQSGIIGHLELNKTLERFRNSRCFLPAEPEDKPSLHCIEFIAVVKESNSRVKNRRSLEAGISSLQLEQMAKDDRDIQQLQDSTGQSESREVVNRPINFRRHKQSSNSTMELLNYVPSTEPGNYDTQVSELLAKASAFVANAAASDTASDGTTPSMGRSNTDSLKSRVGDSEASTLSRPQEFLNSRKFEAIEASNLSIEAKQAAFEALVLGQNPDVVNIEFERSLRLDSAAEQLQPQDRKVQFSKSSKQVGCCMLI